MGYQSRLRTQVQNWTTVLYRSGVARLVVPSHAKERKSMTGRSSLEDSGITPFSGVPPDLDLRDEAILRTPGSLRWLFSIKIHLGSDEKP